MGASETVRGQLGSVRNDPWVPLKHLKRPGATRDPPKRPWGASGAYETTRGRLRSDRNDPGGNTGASETTRQCLGRVQNGQRPPRDGNGPGHLGSIPNGPGATRERPKCLGGFSGVSETAQGHVGTIQNGPGARRDPLKRPWGASGAYEMAQEHVWNVRNGPEATRDHPKQPEGTSGVFDTARECLGSV